MSDLSAALVIRILFVSRHQRSAKSNYCEFLKPQFLFLLRRHFLYLAFAGKY